jgi:tetratricopeptide (TPR) repeat protein
MSAHVARGQLLLQQGRHAEAEREFLLALARDPEQAGIHALLALCQVEQKKSNEARESARKAISLSPDDAFNHYVHALVLHRSDREKEALAAINEAIRLDPHDADHFALLASIHLARDSWTEALTAAEQGLALSPEHVGCANLRAMALVRLGRKAEAAQTVDFALERAPENAFSHANQGWNCLHQNDPRKAQEHFREALRLEPDLEYARNGMLEALKARNPVYRAMLAYFLWMGRQSSRMQWIFIIGSIVVVRVVRQMAATQPLLWIVVVLFYLFIYLSWTAGPMFNLLLRFDRFGRLVLSRDERLATNWFGGTLLAALACLGWALFGRGSLAVFIAGLALLVLTICLAATFNRLGRNRLLLAAATGALALVGGVICYALTTGDRETAMSAIMWFSYGFIGFQLLALALDRK